MAYLVNDETGESVELPEGESTVGRGPLLKITDKRVSRNHALLQLKDGKLKLCPKHKNPCFYKAVDKTAFSVLSRDIWQDLGHGDLFKLLPDALIFRVVEKDSNEKSGSGTLSREQAPQSIVTSKSSAPKNDTDDLLDELFCDPTSITTDAAAPPANGGKKSDSKEAERTTDSKSVNKDTSESNSSHSTTTDISDKKPADSSSSVKSETSVGGKTSKGDSTSNAGSTNKPRKLPDWLAVAASTSSVGEKKKAAAPKKRKSPAKASSTAAAKKRPAEERDSDTLSSPPPPKKKAAAKDVVVSDTSTSGTVDRPASKKEPSKTVSPPTAVTSKPLPPVSKEKEKKKPLCPYGTKCYRKNPAHFREYSHDFSSTDSADIADDGSDNDDSDKPICPYGAECYRKNPIHRKEYRHPGSPASTSKTSGKRRTTRKTAGQRSLLTGDSDDDGEANTYDYNDSFIDDDEGCDSSSYGGDSEDSDWAPPPLAPAGGEGAAAGDDEDDDIDELLSEAKDFIANEKMRKC